MSSVISSFLKSGHKQPGRTSFAGPGTKPSPSSDAGFCIVLHLLPVHGQMALKLCSQTLKWRQGVQRDSTQISERGVIALLPGVYQGRLGLLQQESLPAHLCPDIVGFSCSGQGWEEQVWGSRGAAMGQAGAWSTAFSSFPKQQGCSM